MAYQDDWKHTVPGHEPLRTLHETLRAEIAARHQRGVPFADELFDRWERARALGFGDGTSIYDASVVLGDVQVGTNVWIGPFTVLDGSGGLSIADWCSVSTGVQIYTHATVARALTGGRAPADRAAVRIGPRTYLGPNAVITKGVTIGAGCVIGANALVNLDVPDGAVVFGTPGRIVGRAIVDGDKVELVYDER